MTGSQRGWLELARLPNLFTAAADPLAGFVLVGGALGDVVAWGPLCLASMSLYAGGATLNDACDAHVDARQRPLRPIPSGRVTRRHALLMAAVLLVVGTTVSWVASWRSGAIAAVLVAAIFLYDAVLKPTSIAPVVMGACRALNLLIGALAYQPILGKSVVCVAAGLMGGYVASVTAFARREARHSDPARLVPALLGVCSAAFGFAVLGLVSPCAGASATFGALGTLVPIVVGLPAVRTGEPADVQRAVKWFVLNVIVLDACLAASTAGWFAGVCVLALVAPTIVLARRFPVT